MAFFVYLFVLLVAAGSVIFGMDLTQSPLRPPAYATPSTQTTTSTPPVSAPARIASVAATAPARAKSTAPAPANNVAESTADKAADTSGVAAHAEASVQEAHAEPPVTNAAVSAPNHCAIDACAAAYRSFRASDCTYQPYGAERRLCTKTTSSRRVAALRPAVHHASRSDLRRAYDRAYAERDDNRGSYGDRRRGWAFDLFGDAFGR
jgi:hypothetical protein